MSTVGWTSFPDAPNQQLRRLLDECVRQLDGNLRGVYLHGSLALGCFNPRTSDIDLLVLTERTIPLYTKKTLVECLLSISGAPHDLEISFLRQEDVLPWRYPTPYDLHYGEDWRERYATDLASDAWRRWDEQPHTDPDLAAHIMVTKHRGMCLWGEPIEQVFPDVPHHDYLASIVADLKWARERLAQIAVYGILNSCRVYAYLRERCIASKDEGAVWALGALPAEFHPLIRMALAAYRGACTENSLIDQQDAKRLIEYVLSAVQEKAS
ncbi:MAG: DUF4111 domain-containing protein [Chloroflexales bacterium]|nr:DUF4111 domain-containing protein [Chloroflexales bacterium]